jgi:hypothetical protein
MKSDWISTIEDWPTPKSIRDDQVMLGFRIFYRRFIRQHAKIALPLRELLKQTDRAGERPKGRPRLPKSEHYGKFRSEWTWQAELPFQKLKYPITEAQILQHFNLGNLINHQMDASGFAIAGILNQYHGFSVLRPVNYYFSKCSSAEQNYDSYDRERLAIVETLKQWRHYLDGAIHNISKMYFSDWKPPGVSARMWSVNLNASISGEYQTLGGHFCRPSE